jgi:hypothetical protein
MNPVVETTEVAGFGCTAMIPVFTGSRGGRSFTTRSRSHTGLPFPEAGATLKSEPTRRSHACRVNTCAFGVCVKALLSAGSLFPVHAYKGCTVQAAAVRALFLKNLLLETVIEHLKLIFYKGCVVRVGRNPSPYIPFPLRRHSCW